MSAGGQAMPGPRPGRLGAVFGNLGWLLASSGVTAVLSLVYLGIVSRTLGIADFGRFALITGAAQTIATLMSFETWKIVVQYGLHHEAQGNDPALWRVQKASVLMDLGSAVLGSLVVLALFAFWPDRWGLDAAVTPYAFGFAIVQLITLRSAPTGILRLRDKFGLAAVADSMTAIGRFTGALLAWIFWPTIQGFLLGWMAAEVLTWAAYWLLVHRIGGLGQMLRVRLEWRTLAGENKALLRFMWSTNVQSTLGLASRQLPLLLVGSVAGPAAAGGFRLALQLANALAKISILLTRAAFPEVVRSMQAVPPEQRMRLMVRILLSCTAGAVVAMLLVAVAGRTVLSLIGGKAFAEAYPLLLWLAGAACIEFAAASFEPVMLALHRAGTAMAARAAAVALQFAAMAVLLPALGAMGASISVFLGAALAALFLGAALFGRAVRA